MDAHVFRRLCDSLCPLLQGARLEKIYSPAEHVIVFTVYAQKHKRHLVFRSGRQNPFCYISAERPVALAHPPALIMRYRKYCAGKRIVSCTSDWLKRRIYLLFHTHNPSLTEAEAVIAETWLVLDMREGIQLVLGKCPIPEEDKTPDTCDTIWPEPHRIDDALDNWRQWPIMTPALRRTLPHLDLLDKQALILDLEAGGGDIFSYSQEQESTELSAWPLPKELMKERLERVFENPLDATSFAGDAIVLGKAAARLRNKAALPHEREVARLTRLFEKLDLEEERLNALLQLHEDALLLQNVLWQYPPDTKQNSIEIIPTDSNTALPLRRITLDPRLTLRENMQMFFHKAGRGRRGLDFLQSRRSTLTKQLETVQQRALAAHAGAHENALPPSGTQQSQHVNTQQADVPHGIQAFSSSDGFIIWRGKDAKGNGAVLRAAHAQDLWLHVDGGPGSHCVIRRHFSGQEIPERTLHEAASLAAVKSWQKDNPYADILCAHVKHVKPMRNAARGMVRIDKVLQSFRVSIDGDIEQKLAL